VPILDRPVMEHTLGLLKQHGFEEVIVSLQYMATVIQNYFGDGEAFGLKIQYTIEELPLGTAGSVKLAEVLLDEPFLVMSGDALADFDLRAVMAFHARTNSQAT